MSYDIVYSIFHHEHANSSVNIDVIKIQANTKITIKYKKSH